MTPAEVFVAQLQPAVVPAGAFDALAGRDRELARLESEFQEARSARSFRVVFVRGPAGVGRTALLSALETRFRSWEIPVLAARAPRPTGAAWTLARPLADGAFALVRPAMSLPTRTSLEERLAPLFGKAAQAGQGPMELGAAFAELVLAAARDRALALVLDDVDAADAASFGLVSYLLATLGLPGATRAPDEAVAGGLVVVSLRDESASERLQELVARTPAVSLPLAPLDVDGVRAWLSRHGAERLFEATGGVPGRLEELLAGGTAIDFAARRLERVASAEREVLAALAVLGHPADAELVAKASGRRDAGAKLARLAQAHLVSATPGAGRTLYALAREADRRALLDGLTTAERAALQVRAGEALESRGELDQAFAHWADAGDSRAIPAGLRASEALAERAALEPARAVLERVVAVATGGPKATALLALASIAEKLGETRLALSALGRARALLPVERRREIRARSARLCLAIGAPKPAERLARAVLKDPAQDVARADATVALAEARFLRGAYEEALEVARTELPAPQGLALGNTRGKALLTLGRLDEAREAFGANAKASEAAHDAAERARALLNVGVVAHRQGGRGEARAAYRDALGLGDSPFRAIVHANLASLALEEGEAEEALVQSHRALAAFASKGRAKEQAHAAQNLARVYLYLGDLARSEELATHASQLAARVGDPYLAAGAGLVRAEVLLARGDESASAALSASAERFAELKNPRYRRESLLLLAEAEVVRERRDAARQALEMARDAGALSSAALAAELHLLEAELALAHPDESSASASLAAAREALLTQPQLELPARLYFLNGALAEVRGQPALAQAERLKAARLVDELAQKVPPDRRAMFYARRRRRAILDAAGRLVAEAHRLSPTPVVRAGDAPNPIVGRSGAIQRLNGLIERIGPATATVLVRGESGTGKELVAKALHEHSARRHMPLVAVNCGALNEELLLSELFGHEKGSFTGAIREKKGRFELADGGTIFLDEIGDISPRAQVALLRALQERTFERVGGTRSITVDVRVVCATNRNLEDLMAKGLFREDLYYRLRGATLTLPSLRERAEDIPLLAEHFLARHADTRAEKPKALAPEAVRLLARYPWPGNVRELFNVLESASLFAGGQSLGPEAFELFPELFAPAAPLAPAPASVPAAPVAAPAPVTPVAAPPVPESVSRPATAASGPATVDFYGLMRGRDLSLKDLRHELDIACIAAALGEGGGNISEAARLLKMKRSRLSQIVNAEPVLRALCRGHQDVGGADDDGEDEGGPGLAGGTR